METLMEIGSKNEERGMERLASAGQKTPENTSAAPYTNTSTLNQV